MEEHEDFPLTALTWGALLARWTEFARASVSFPRDGSGDRWRASVAPVIGLQATTFALGDVDTLGAQERALGLDRAGVLVRTHAGELHALWRGEAMPEALLDVVNDAQRALLLARDRGVEYRVAGERTAAPDALAALAPYGGTVRFALAPTPGTALFHGEPGLFVRPALDGLVLEGFEPVPSPPRQVYRTAAEGSARDVIALLDDALQAGTPLLRVVIDGGEVVARFDAADHARASRVERAEVVEKPIDEDRIG